jgi:hypothetical protein
MPKQKTRLSPEEQQKRFQEEAERRRKARLLDPDDMDADLDALVRKSIRDHGA